MTSALSRCCALDDGAHPGKVLLKIFIDRDQTMLTALMNIALGYALAVPGAATPPPAATNAALCLNPNVEWAGLLNYSRGTRFIPYQYVLTGVPDSSMRNQPYTSILFLSHNRHKALLLFVFRLPDGRLETMLNGYLMRKTSHGWEASEGNGGPGMYQRVEKFVTDLEKTPEYLLDRRADTPSTCIAEEEYDQEYRKSHKDQ
jgi:hypothetical protein